MSNFSAEEFEAIQAVVDRVGAYQDGAPEGTVEAELAEGLTKADISLEQTEITTLADAIEKGDGPVTASDVLG